MVETASLTNSNIKAEDYKKYVHRASLAAICVASILITIKLFVVIISNSISLYASLMDSVFDLACSAINLLILRQATKPADSDHSFGHGKFEYFGILGQSIFLGTLASLLIVSAISRFSHPVPIENTGPSIVILLITIIMTFSLVTYQGKIVKLTESDLVKSDQAHYKMDLLMNASVVVAIVCGYFGWTFVDSILALIIGGYMLISIFTMIKNAIDGLTDKALPEEDLLIIKTIAKQHPKVIDIHDLRTRQSANTRHIQFHLELDDSLTLLRCHDICDEVETTIKAIFDDALITIHPEPSKVVREEKAGTYQAKSNPQLIEEVVHIVEEEQQKEDERKLKEKHIKEKYHQARKLEKEARKQALKAAKLQEQIAKQEEMARYYAFEALKLSEEAKQEEKVYDASYHIPYRERAELHDDKDLDLEIEKELELDLANDPTSAQEKVKEKYSFLGIDPRIKEKPASNEDKGQKFFSQAQTDAKASQAQEREEKTKEEKTNEG